MRLYVRAALALVATFPSFALPACTAPSPLDASFFSLTDATGHRTNDFGNFDSCRALGDAQHCVVIADDILLGVCVPSSCGTGDLVNTSSSIWRDYPVLQAPFLLVLEIAAAASNSTLAVTAYCGTDALELGAEVGVTAVTLAVLSAVVLVCTARELLRPHGHSPHSGSVTGPRSQRLAALLACMRSSSLTVTLPPLLGADVPRPLAHGTARLDALDGVRALSALLVVLGHALYFPTLFPSGYSNSESVIPFIVSPAGQVVPSAEFAVDSFFLLS